MSGNPSDKDMMEGNGLADNVFILDCTTSQDDEARSEQKDVTDLTNAVRTLDLTAPQDNMKRPEQENMEEGNIVANIAFSLAGTTSRDNKTRHGRTLAEARQEAGSPTGAADIFGTLREPRWTSTECSPRLTGLGASSSDSRTTTPSTERDSSLEGDKNPRLGSISSLVESTPSSAEHNNTLAEQNNSSAEQNNSSTEPTNSFSGSEQAPEVHSAIVRHRAERLGGGNNSGYAPSSLPPTHPDFVQVRRGPINQVQPQEAPRTSPWGSSGNRILKLLGGNNEVVDLTMIPARPHYDESPTPAPLSLYVIDGRLWGQFIVGDVKGCLSCTRKLSGRVESLTFTWRGFNSEQYFWGDNHFGYLLFHSDGTVEFQLADLSKRYKSQDVVNHRTPNDFELKAIMDGWNGLDPDVMKLEARNQQQMLMLEREKAIYEDRSGSSAAQ